MCKQTQAYIRFQPFVEVIVSKSSHAFQTASHNGGNPAIDLIHHSGSRLTQSDHKFKSGFHYGLVFFFQLIHINSRVFAFCRGIQE